MELLAQYPIMFVTSEIFSIVFAYAFHNYIKIRKNDTRRYEALLILVMLVSALRVCISVSALYLGTVDEFVIALVLFADFVCGLTYWGAMYIFGRMTTGANLKDDYPNIPFI